MKKVVVLFMFIFIPSYMQINHGGCVCVCVCVCVCDNILVNFHTSLIDCASISMFNFLHTFLMKYRGKSNTLYACFCPTKGFIRTLTFIKTLEVACRGPKKFMSVLALKRQVTSISWKCLTKILKSKFVNRKARK